MRGNWDGCKRSQMEYLKTCETTKNGGLDEGAVVLGFAHCIQGRQRYGPLSAPHLTANAGIWRLVTQNWCWC